MFGLGTRKRLSTIDFEGEFSKKLATRWGRVDTETTKSIVKVIFNGPATIVFWNDETKTVVTCDGESFDPEKGLAMAISKKLLGNKGNYYNEFKRWLPEEDTNTPFTRDKDIQ